MDKLKELIKFSGMRCRARWTCLQGLCLYHFFYAVLIAGFYLGPTQFLKFVQSYVFFNFSFACAIGSKLQPWEKTTQVDKGSVTSTIGREPSVFVSIAGFRIFKGCKLETQIRHLSCGG